MIMKTATGLALAAACLATIAATPADAQTAGTYGGPQTYQGSTSPNWSADTSGSSMAPSSADAGLTVVMPASARARRGF